MRRPEIKLTFKENERDIYEYAQKHSSASAFIKDILRAEMEKEKCPQKADTADIQF